MIEENKTTTSPSEGDGVPAHIREAASLVKDVFARIQATERPEPPAEEQDDEWFEED